jgi:hypothetical protein
MVRSFIYLGGFNSNDELENDLALSAGRRDIDRYLIGDGCHRSSNVISERRWSAACRETR